MRSRWIVGLGKTHLSDIFHQFTVTIPLEIVSKFFVLKKEKFSSPLFLVYLFTLTYPIGLYRAQEVLLSRSAPKIIWISLSFRAGSVFVDGTVISLSSILNENLDS